MRRRGPCIAIDGPVGAGKSTIARLLAQRLGYIYIDTGAMYRGIAWAAHRHDLTGDDADPIIHLLQRTDIKLRPHPDGTNEVVVDGEDVTGEIRSPEIGQLASRLSALPAVRRRLVALQQAMAREGSVVMEGRDIQTVVLPHADVKIFLTAPAEERARRRWLELGQRGRVADEQQVLAEIRARDERDSTRQDSPLKPAPDAVHVDTGGLTINQVVEKILEVVRDRTGSQ